MPIFSYSAIEATTGRERSGTLESEDTEQAAAALKARGLAPVSLARKSGVPVRAAAPDRGRSPAPADRPSPTPRRNLTFGRAVGDRTVTLFTRQLATLVKAGMPLLRAIDVLGRQEKNPAFRRALEQLAETVRSGGNLSDGLLPYPGMFDRLYVNMVRAGEAGGALGTVLDRLARFREKGERIRAKVRSAMMYPLIVIALSVGIVAALMVFVVPKFEQIFAGMLRGQPLPGLTRFVLSVSALVQDHAVISLTVAALCFAGFVALQRTRRGVRALDWWKIRQPLLGELFLKVTIARFTRTFGTLLSSGVPILQALLITRDTSGNAHVADAIDVVHDRVKGGDTVARPLGGTGIFPGMVTSMIEVGEETGALPEMLTRIADTYDEEVDNAVASLTSLIEPFMIVFLAVMVGTVVIALFLPIVSIIQHLQ